jgi:hypothetical protein
MNVNQIEHMEEYRGEKFICHMHHHELEACVYRRMTAKDGCLASALEYTKLQNVLVVVHPRNRTGSCLHL